MATPPDRMEIPDGWRIDGKHIERQHGGVRVRMESGDLVIVGEDVHDGFLSIPLAVVHAAGKLAEVTAALDQERARLLAERFAGES